MKVKIKIKTVKGYAKSTQKKIVPLIMGSARVRHEVYANKADDTIIWLVEGQPRHIMKVTNNIAKFDVAMSKILKSKKVRKISKLSDEDRGVLDMMLHEQTSIEVIKKATKEEINIDNRNIWHKVKSKFR